MSHPDVREVEFNGHLLSFDLALGGRLTRWQYQGFELIGSQGSDPVENGCYPMAPWAGRLADNAFIWASESTSLDANYQGFALHGFLLDRPVGEFSIVELPDAIEVHIQTSISNWIAQLSIEMCWRISQHQLESRISAVTSSPDPVPVVLGWHPWFNNTVNNSQKLDIDFSELELAVRDGNFPSGQFVRAIEAEGPFDDVFVSPTKSVNLTWGSELSLDVVNSHEWFVIYNGAREFTCVEPQTGPPNAFNKSLGCRTLTTTVDNPLTMTTAWSLSIPK